MKGLLWVLSRVSILLMVLLLGVGSGLGPTHELQAAYSTPIEQKLQPTGDNLTGENLGYGVAISGDTAVVGAPYKNSYAGAAYVFTRGNDGNWSQQQELDGTTPWEVFGASVAMSGDTIVVGAPQPGGTGTAYIFVRDSNGVWSQQAKLIADTPTAGSFFGYTVAISGNTVVIAAFPDNRYTAYIFVRNSTSWSQQGPKLTAGDAANDSFNPSVAISGDTVVVGARLQDSGKGAAYVFTRSNGTWSQQQKLTASDATAGDWFGLTPLVASSDTILVGAPGNHTGAGAVYVFTLNGTIWSQHQKLTASDATAGDWFGTEMAISGDTVVVGALQNGNIGAGAAYVFALSGTIWSQQQKLTASDTAPGDWFSRSVAISNDTVLVGAPLKNSGDGAAYAFIIPLTTYGFLGPQSPYAAPPAEFKAGSTIPLKWQYAGYAGNVVNSAMANPEVYINGTLAVAPGNSAYRYDSLNMTWQFNWKTTGFKAGIYTIQIISGQTGQENDFLVQLK